MFILLVILLVVNSSQAFSALQTNSHRTDPILEALRAILYEVNVIYIGAYNLDIKAIE